MVIARPVVTLVLGVVFLGGLALAATAYTSSGFGGTSTGPAGSDSAAGTAAVNAHYPAAVANPTVVLLVYKSSVWADLTPVQHAENDLANKPVFASVNGLLNPNGTAVSTQQLESLYKELGPPGKLPATQPPNSPVSPQQYAAYRATTQFVSPNGKTVQFYTTLKAGASTTTAALNATPAVRSAVGSVQHAVGAADNGVNGLAPASYDVSSVSQSDLKKIVPIVAALLALLLGLVLRSVIAPLYLGGDRRLELLRRAGHRGPDLPGRRRRLRPRLRAALPAVCVPDGARRGLQHLGHDPYPRRSTQGAAASGGRRCHAPHRHHRDLGRADPGRHLRRCRPDRCHHPDQGAGAPR